MQQSTAKILQFPCHQASTASAARWMRVKHTPLGLGANRALAARNAQDLHSSASRSRRTGGSMLAHPMHLAPLARRRVL